MIILTRLGNGMQIAVNPDLIERAEHTPDTVITLVDGHKLVVEEPIGEVVRLIRTWRASVATEAIALHRLDADGARHTSALPGPDARGAGRGDGRPVRGGFPHPRDTGADDDLRDAALADESAHTSALGRVLRLPAREV